VAFTLRQAVRTWQLWLLIAALFFGGYSLNTNTTVLVPYFEEIGFSAAVAASAVSVYGLFSVVARFFWGGVAGRFSVRPALVAQTALTALGVVFLLVIESQAGLYLACAFQGMMLGGYPTLQALIVPGFFGRRHIGSIVGFTQLFTTLAYAGGPLLAGAIFDRTGTYETTFWLLVVTWLTCSLLAFSVSRPREPVAGLTAAHGRTAVDEIG
jgi:MFS family permease